MQAGAIVDIADVHARALAHGLKAPQDGDPAGIVGLVSGRRGVGSVVNGRRGFLLDLGHAKRTPTTHPRAGGGVEKS